MDLQYHTETHVTPNREFLGNLIHLGDTVGASFTLSQFTRATHYPDGFLIPGLIVALNTSGASSGLWGAYVHDNNLGGNTGLDTPGGILVDPLRVRLDRDGQEIATVVAGSILPAGVPQPVFLGKLPGLLNNAAAAYVPLVADLPTNFYDIT